MDEIILFNKITELYTSVNTQLAERPVVPGTLVSLVSWVRQGDEVQGGQTKFPFPWFSDRGEELNPYEELAAVAPELVSLLATVKEYGMKPRMIARGTKLADIYGILDRFAPSMLSAAANLQEYHLASMLGQGETSTVTHAYDNLPFFSDSKLINPNKASLGTFDNLFQGLRLDRDGLIKMIDFLDAVPGPDGLPLNMPGQIYIVCSNEEQFNRASDLLMGQTLATAVGNAAASQSNEGLKGRAIPVKSSVLRTWNSNKAWYGLKVASPTHRPVIASVKEAPQIIVEGLDPAEHVRSTRNITKYSWRGFWGIDPGYAQLAGKAIEP